jgi:chromosome segregation ATPase
MDNTQLNSQGAAGQPPTAKPYATLQAANVRLQKQRDEYAAKVDEITDENTTLKEQIKHLEERIKHLEATNDTLRNQALKRQRLPEDSFTVDALKSTNQALEKDLIPQLVFALYADSTIKQHLRARMDGVATHEEFLMEVLPATLRYIKTTAESTLDEAMGKIALMGGSDAVLVTLHIADEAESEEEFASKFDKRYQLVKDVRDRLEKDHYNWMHDWSINLAAYIAVTLNNEPDYDGIRKEDGALQGPDFEADISGFRHYTMQSGNKRHY